MSEQVRKCSWYQQPVSPSQHTVFTKQFLGQLHLNYSIALIPILQHIPRPRQSQRMSTEEFFRLTLRCIQIALVKHEITSKPKCEPYNHQNHLSGKIFADSNTLAVQAAKYVWDIKFIFLICSNIFVIQQTTTTLAVSRSAQDSLGHKYVPHYQSDIALISIKHVHFPRTDPLPNYVKLRQSWIKYLKKNYNSVQKCFTHPC